MAGMSHRQEMERRKLQNAVHSDRVEEVFDSVAIPLFRYQAEYNLIYQKYINLLNIDPKAVMCLEDIPFLPISFFKSHAVVSGEARQDAVVFRSSGTTGQSPSCHIVPDLDFYLENTIRAYQQFFSHDLEDLYFLALLPSYLEREDASLVHMAREFARRSRSLDEHFYLDDFAGLKEVLDKLDGSGRPVVLMGVTFALLDFSARYPGRYQNLTVIETGGMKGRGEELIRPALHEKLSRGFAGAKLSSEYGMTELLSQAYWRDGFFYAPPTMRIFPRDSTDPLARSGWGQSAVLDIVDLANIDSCSFVSTEDLGRVQEGGVQFEVLGRLDTAEIRGCNLMYAG